MPATVKSNQSECQGPVSTSNYTSENENYSDGHQIREAVLDVSGKESHLTNDVARWMAAHCDRVTKNGPSACENNLSLAKKSQQESLTCELADQVAPHSGKNIALKERFPLPGSPAIAIRHYSQEQIYKNYPFCAPLNNSSSACASEIRCSKNTTLSTPVGDQEKAQKPLYESQLFSSSQVDHKESVRVHTKQPKSVIDRAIEVNLTTRQLKQVEYKQMDGDAGDISHFETGDSNTGYKRKGDLKDYNFDQFQAKGNDLTQRKEGCFNIAANSMTTNGSSLTNNFSNNYVQQPPNSLFCSEKYGSDQRRLLSSVSSDPEVYTKTPSIEKLNDQIQKLRNDMLALRSTTASYKQYMENIFDELKQFVIVHNHEPMLRTNIPADISANETNKIDDQPQLKSYLKDYAHAEKTNEVNEPFTYSKFYVPAATSQALNASTSTPNSTDTQHHVIQQLHAEDCNTRRIKITDRPNSDPFVSCSIGSEEIFSAKQSPGLLMPTKYAVKSADSSLENGSKRAKGTSEELRILSVLCKSNAGHHISECSIDSGYQGSFITSPKERLGRELSSQTVTPASPISESLVEATVTSPVASKQLVIDHSSKRLHPTDPCNNDSFSSVINHQSANSLSQTEQKRYHVMEKIRNDFLITNGAVKGQPNNDESANVSPRELQQRLKSCNSSEAIEKSSKAEIASRSEVFTRFNSSASGADKANRARPIPKQRTIFSIANSYSVEDLASISSVLSSEEMKGHDGSLVDEKITLHQTDCDGQNLSVSRDVEKTSGFEIVDKQCPTRPTPPQCLTVIKPNTQLHVDSGSPLQSRVKLGVSAIKQLTPNNERKEGSVFYCSGQVSQATNDARSRMRKTANTKQLLREKFAAAVERSNAAAAKKEGKADSDENEWSMVRRRSMRMMTEFQIFDFKGSCAAKNPNPGERKTKSSEMHFNQKQHWFKAHSPTPKKLNHVEVPPKSYSVSPSAATVSKDIFVETHVASTLLQSKPTHNSSNTSKIKPTHTCYAGESLPPPVSCPSRTPCKEEDGPITGSSIPVSEIPAKAAKQPAFLAPLIRPKPSIPSKQPDELTGHSIPNTATYHGLKLSPNSKSAFTPVASGNDTNDSTVVTENAKPSDVTLQDTSFPVEPTRRLSLPQTKLSNKQRFINEFMPDSPLATPKSPASEESLPGFQRRTSIRTPRKHVEALIATKTTVNQSYPIEKSEKKQLSEKPEAKKSNEKAEYVTTEPLFSRLPKKESGLSEDKRRSHASTSKATTSTGGRPNLENQPIQFDKSEKLNNVVGALRNAGYLRPTYLPLNTQKTSVSASSSLGKGKRCLKENNIVSSPALPRGRTNFPLETHGQIQACFKARSSTSLHQYETVKLTDNSRDASEKLKNAKVSSKDVPPDETSRPQVQRSHKSTIALIRASLLGKRDKTPRTATAEGKRDRAVVGGKVRSSSVGDKLKVNESSIFEIKPSKSKSKEKSKKSKSQKEKGSGKKSVKETHQNVELSAYADTPNDETFVFPSPNELVYGNPDSEVMERFLAAAAAAASNTPRSPLQRLRSSFRTPKHKNRIVHETRIKDDMAVPMRNDRSEYVVQSNTKMHNGQEFTYV